MAVTARVNKQAASDVRRYAKTLREASSGKEALKAAKALKSAAGKVLATPASNSVLKSAAGKVLSAPQLPSKTPRKRS